MARKKTTDEQGESNTATAEHPLAPPNDHTQAPVTREPGDEPEPQPHKWAKPRDPLATRSMAATNNSVHLMRSEKDKAWLIRFDENPNLGREEGDPHPVLAYLKSEKYRWEESQADGERAWGKAWEEGHFSYPEYLEARRVMQRAAEMVGAKVEQGQQPF